MKIKTLTYIFIFTSVFPVNIGISTAEHNQPLNHKLLALKREAIILQEGEIAQCAFKGSDRSRYSSSSGNLRYVSGDVKFKCALIKIGKSKNVDTRFISNRTVDLKCRRGLPMMMTGMPIKHDRDVIGYRLSCVDSPQ
jgi:hypothetical protein